MSDENGWSLKRLDIQIGIHTFRAQDSKYEQAVNTTNQKTLWSIHRRVYRSLSSSLPLAVMATKRLPAAGRQLNCYPWLWHPNRILAVISIMLPSGIQRTSSVHTSRAGCYDTLKTTSRHLITSRRCWLPSRTIKSRSRWKQPPR